MIPSKSGELLDFQADPVYPRRVAECGTRRTTPEETRGGHAGRRRCDRGASRRG
jgi:hypothetical protein